jgi:hypothetical protein
MNITTAIIYLNGTVLTTVESECLVSCSGDGQDSGRDIDAVRQTLTQAFSEIHEGDVEVLFPELEECSL